MSKRCFLFVCLNGRVSFWEYAEGTLLSRSIHNETSSALAGFWEKWKSAYRLDEDEPRDFLYLCDTRISDHDVPEWFGKYAIEISTWTRERLRDVISTWEELAHRTVTVEFNGRRSTLWHGGNQLSSVILYGFSASDLGFTIDKPEESCDAEKLAMALFLSGAEERHAQNERCCKSRR